MDRRLHRSDPHPHRGGCVSQPVRLTHEAGKSRLALEVAVNRAGEHLDGVWLVDIGGLADPALVPQAVASVLGVHERASRPLIEAVVAYLRPRSVLLVLDGCEHLVEACAEIAVALLHACPKLRILATSRRALGVAGETLRSVPGLRAPDPG